MLLQKQCPCHDNPNVFTLLKTLFVGKYVELLLRVLNLTFLFNRILWNWGESRESLNLEDVTMAS